jgi:hypothetical protein
MPFWATEKFQLPKTFDGHPTHLHHQMATKKIQSPSDGGVCQMAITIR